MDRSDRVSLEGPARAASEGLVKTMGKVGAAHGVSFPPSHTESPEVAPVSV